MNIASVNYHFGSKENLVIEILDRVVAPINRERIQLLDELETDGALDTRAVLRAFLLPDLRAINRLRQRDPLLPRFVSRMYSEGSELMGQVIGRQFAEIHQRFSATLGRTLPDLNREEVDWRLHCIVGMVIYLFATVEAPGMSPLISDDTDRDLQRLLDVTTPLMNASRQEVDNSDR